MENIIAAEILCTKLQDSDKPLEIGIGMALRVVLDENIVLEERAQSLNTVLCNRNKAYKEMVCKYNDTSNTLTELKEANRILTVEIEQANALIKLYKERNIGNSRAVLLRGEVTVIDSITKLHELSKSQQTSIQFPANVPTTHISEEEKQRSIYYKSAKRRAEKIWKYIEKEPINTAIFTKYILNWNTTFHIVPGTPIIYNHVEAACMPKCYGGLGIIIGMKLESWVESQIKNK